MTPYYSDPDVTIYHGDSLDVLTTTLAQVSVDLIVTDPPYGVAWRSGRRTEALRPIEGDGATYDPRAVLGTAMSRLKGNRHVYIFGRFDLTGLPLGGTTELVWDKGRANPGDLSLPWGPSWEPILFGVYAPSRANRERGDGRLSARLRQGSVLRVARLNSRAVSAHPTEKPVLLLRYLIESSSLIGETVLDPYMGSGSTLEAALVEGRKAIGIEIDERYCESAAKRVLAVRRG